MSSYDSNAHENSFTNFAKKNMRIANKKQYIISITLICFISFFCFLLDDYISYHIVALILLLTVSVLAVLYDIIPVIIATLLSALILNFFFIDPIFHYKINGAENTLLFFIFLLVGSVGAALTYRIKKQEQKIREKEEKEKVIKLYNSLFSSLSHELKTPIATIIGAVDTLKEQESLSETHKAILLSEIEIASMRLNRQVENLLNMNRLETGNLQLKRDWCDVNELIFIVIGKMQFTHKQNINFIPNESTPLFKIDDGLIEQALYCIIHNATIYTPDESTITISVAENNESLVITIADNGNGFPEDKIEKVFDKFYRLPNNKVGGTGLGLSIAKGFVEAHNGSITLENQPSGGAKFTIIIPCELSYINNLKNE